ncbi:MAG: DNA mismatch endonuclease Vsr [Rhodospirillales bacterium]|nr:DNA mismatch endonuclease Vsr [Rhodospirillales bacterium]
MVDCHTPSQRSHNMSRIRSAGTRPELIVRKIAHRLGLRFRLHRRDLPGTPDLVFPKHRAVVFVHGCFWHQHEGCRFAKLPRSRPEYWLPKLARNVDRDAEARRLLEAASWQVLEIWECETRNPPAIEDLLRQFFDFGR